MFARVLNTIQGRLILLAVVASLALLATGWFARSTIEAVKINSDAYQRIVRQKDVLSDLTPAALNVVRANSSVTGADPSARPEVIASILNDVKRDKALFDA